MTWVPTPPPFPRREGEVTRRLRTQRVKLFCLIPAHMEKGEGDKELQEGTSFSDSLYYRDKKIQFLSG